MFTITIGLSVARNNYALYDIIKNSGAKCVIEGLDVWAEFEEEKNLTMFILRWS